MKKLFIVFCLAMLALVACSDNLFGKSDSPDAKSLRLDAEDAFRKGNYAKAYEICNKIIANDSAASYGYYCAAQAGFRGIKPYEGINPFELLDKVDRDRLGNDESYIPFKEDADTIATQIYRTMLTVYSPLKELNRRDSLNLLWELSKLSKSELAGVSGLPKTLDSLRNVGKLDSVIAVFQQQNNINDFPLTDGEYKSSTYLVDFTFVNTLKMIFNLLDINNDSCIVRMPAKDGSGTNDKVYNKFFNKNIGIWKCNFGIFEETFNRYRYDLGIDFTELIKNGEKPDFGVILDELGIDDKYIKEYQEEGELPPEVEDLNRKIDDFNGDSKELLDLIGKGEGSMTEEEKENFEEFKKYSSFYKVGTHIDEDGDGCIDEGSFYGMADGDGANGANARFLDTLVVKTIDNTLSADPEDNKIVHWSPGTIIDICNDPRCEKTTRLEPRSVDSIGTEKVVALNFALKNGYWTSDSLDLKFSVAQDTVCGEIKYDLEARKRLVGGCWVNYNETQFIDRILKRNLATKADQEKRVHPKCKTCKGQACIR